MTETPRATETNNLPYDFEFGELDDDEVPDSEGQGCPLCSQLPSSLRNKWGS